MEINEITPPPGFGNVDPIRFRNSDPLSDVIIMFIVMKCMEMYGTKCHQIMNSMNRNVIDLLIVSRFAVYSKHGIDLFNKE